MADLACELDKQPVRASYTLDFAYAYGRPQAFARMRAVPADFRVEELANFAAGEAGQGEHVYLHLEKTLQNTAQLAARIAAIAGVKPMDVGYAGMKDRNAITRQWFSIYLPRAQEPDWAALEDDNTRLLEVTRRARKLRRGEHSGNKFVIRLLSLEGNIPDLEYRLGQIAALGVPNYFGPQRFGRECSNLVSADNLFVHGRRLRSRTQRGLVLSAARSYLFNRVLSARVTAGIWQQQLEGDVVNVRGDGPTGPLWGRGQLPSSAAIAELEQDATRDFEHWRDGLEHAGLQQERRSLCLYPRQFSWNRLASEVPGDGDQLELEFVLPPGEFATSVLRELVDVEDLRCRNGATENLDSAR